MMQAAAVLLCLVLCSCYFVAGMLAKFVTSDSDSDGARVAKFVFNVTNKGTSRMIDLNGIEKPGDTLSYDFSVRNSASGSTSEVSERYEISLRINGSMPLTCTVLRGETSIVSATMPGQDTALERTGSDDSCVFAPGSGASHDYKLKVEWPATENNLDYASAATCAKVELIVTGYQVD